MQIRPVLNRFVRAGDDMGRVMQDFMQVLGDRTFLSSQRCNIGISLWDLARFCFRL
jgi:hypothetical protein